MFGDIDAYSATLRGAQLGARGIASPALFEHQKKVIFGRKALIVSIFGLNFSFKM